MSIREWSITAPSDIAWTPEEVAQIVRAAQAFQAALPYGGQFDQILLGGIDVIAPQSVIDLRNGRCASRPLTEKEIAPDPGWTHHGR